MCPYEAHVRGEYRSSAGHQENNIIASSLKKIKQGESEYWGKHALFHLGHRKVTFVQ